MVQVAERPGSMTGSWPSAGVSTFLTLWQSSHTWLLLPGSVQVPSVSLVVFQ